MSAADFESFLTVLYAPRITWKEPDLAQHYVPAYRIAKQVGYEELEPCILPLIEAQLDDVDKIIFAREFDKEEWLINSHMRLSKRKEPLTPQEARKLGLESVHMICHLREEILYVAPTHLCLSHMGRTCSNGSTACSKCNSTASVLCQAAGVTGLTDESIKSRINDKLKAEREALEKERAKGSVP
ncbi:The BTB (BR-C, ttk and bab)/POZ (Pox virus and Zinc finger) domain [Ceratobasidium sp. AG-Ba]|nr:The BTB (BR-C, ttk and bab)/POZ (Pox virus and Zinc finger) domain [Ceratobasidium sp. AG-Ba]